jgi:hypothetical protein
VTTPFPFVAGAVLEAAQLNAITELPINDKTASYTLAAGDAGEYVIMNSATATTITVNNSIFSAGQIVYIVNKGSANTVLTAGTGVTISTSASLTVSANGSGRLLALSASAFIYEAGDRALQTKLISTTRDMTAASGNVSYTGAGFTPTAAWVVSAIAFGVECVGHADSARSAGVRYSLPGANTNYPSGVFFTLETASGNLQSATIASYDSDGLTLTWTKTASPTGTASIYFLVAR